MVGTKPTRGHEELDQFVVLGIAVLVAALVASVVVLLVRRPGSSGAGWDVSRIQLLEADLLALREAKADAERRLAVSEERASRVPTLEGTLAEKNVLIDQLRDGRASAERDLAAMTEAVKQTREALGRALARSSELDAQLKETSERADFVRNERFKLEEELSKTEEAARHNAVTLVELRQRLESAEKISADLQLRLGAIQEEKAALGRSGAESATLLNQKVEALERQHRELDETSTALRATRGELASLREAHVRLQETLDQEMRKSAEKLLLLQEAKEQMSQQFKVLAEEVMKNHGETFSKQNREQLDGLLTPVREKLTEFQQGLQAAHTESAKERATLGEQIRALTETSAKMSNETQNLTRALKGKAQTQGAWGEMILSTILERSGLRKGEEYLQQETHLTEEGGRLRPDVIINLPNAEQLVIDSKVSLTAFEGFVNAEDDAERASCLARHLASVRGHIKILARKEYQQATGSGLNFVIMFVPVEGALAVALQEDPAITAMAAESHVAIATPTTLMMALRTVASLWQVERRNLNAEAIAKRAGLIYDKFVGFIGDMETLGGRLRQAQQSYDDAFNKLKLGQGNLVGQVGELKKMGAKTVKALPATVTGDINQPTTVPEVKALPA
jgi:DNA recombination protein RmuC